MPREVRIEVHGSPAPKGSGRAMLIRGRARNVPSGSNANRDALRSWDVALRMAALTALDGRIDRGPDGLPLAPFFLDAALDLTVEFRLVRPSGHWGKRGLLPSAPAHHVKKPDLDKLLRTLDSLTGLVWDDDSRIVEIAATKTFAAPGYEGATIVVRGGWPSVGDPGADQEGA